MLRAVIRSRLIAAALVGMDQEFAMKATSAA
jgi:hypothetical protein